MAKASSGDSQGKRAAEARRKSARVQPASQGLSAIQVAAGSPPAELQRLAEAVEAHGGRSLGNYRDPLGGHWHILASLPLDQVVPTPFQRDLSETHVKRLVDVIGRTGRFLDPIIAVLNEQGQFWTPNGHHRLAAMRLLGAQAITAIVVHDRQVAYQILALNTEKGHNLREKALEVIRMARSLAELDPRPEREFALEFEEPAFLTLGLSYEQRGRFAGGAYHPVLRRADQFLAASLPKALEKRAGWAGRLLELDDQVNVAVAALKEKGFTSPYLKSFVVARVNPLRFQRGAVKTDLDETLQKMTAAAKRFDAAKVKLDDVAGSFGGAGEEG